MEINLALFEPKDDQDTVNAETERALLVCMFICSEPVPPLRHTHDPEPWINYMIAKAQGELMSPYPPSAYTRLADWVVERDPLYFIDLPEESHRRGGISLQEVCNHLFQIIRGDDEYLFYHKRRYALQALLDA